MPKTHVTEEHPGKEANGKLPTDEELVELAPGESIEEWADRFATTMAEREAKLEKKLARWTPLSLIGLKVR